MIRVLRISTAILLLNATAAYASFHFMQIEQLIGGVEGDVTAQAIQLRLASTGQNQVQNGRLVAYDAEGNNPVIVSDMMTSVTNGAAGARVLIVSTRFMATQDPVINADFTFDNLIPEAYLDAGRLTFENNSGTTIVWSVCWGGGGYTGPTIGDPRNDDDGDFGPCIPSPLPSADTAALVFDGAPGDPSTTNAADYVSTGPDATFINNAGQSTTVYAPQRSGQTPGGAFYTIEVPAGWQPADGLAIWNHGFSLSPPDADVDLGPLANLQRSEGYAIAASSYRQNGWALFHTAEDIRELIAVFQDEVGTPDQILVYGASLGGLVTAQLLEEPGLTINGALPICGALAGSRVWDGALDLRLAYDVICSDVPDAAIPGGATGLPNPPDPAFDQTALTAALDACTGIADPGNRTASQQANLDRLLAVTTLPEEFLLTHLGFATFSLADLIFDPGKLDGASAMHNSEVNYPDAGVDMDIARITSDHFDRQRFLDNFTPSGVIGDTKIISIHTDKDGLVLVENESWYGERVPSDQFTLGIVVEDNPSHCGFTEGELVSAWESLRGWVAGLPQPDAAGLQATCQALVAGDLAAGPCRFDAAFEVGDFDARVAPRAGIFGSGFEARGVDRREP